MLLAERTCPVFREICQTANADGSQSAPIHVVIGNAGYELSWFANPNVSSLLVCLPTLALLGMQLAPAAWPVSFIQNMELSAAAAGMLPTCNMLTSTALD